jgi:hypothetical protein
MEARFRAKNIYEEWDRFDFAVAALSKEVIQLCFAVFPKQGRALHQAR